MNEKFKNDVFALTVQKTKKGKEKIKNKMKHVGLLVAINEGVWVDTYAGTLHFVDHDGTVTKLTSGSDCNDAQDIESWGFCNENLYFNSSKNIDSLLRGPKVASRSDHWAFVCCHKGDLYDYIRKKIVKTLTGDIVCDCTSFIHKLCSTGKKLFALAPYIGIVDVEEKKVFTPFYTVSLAKALARKKKEKRKNWYCDMYAAGEKVFGVEYAEDIKETGIARIVDVMNNTRIGERAGYIRDIVLHKGVLYDTAAIDGKNHICSTADLRNKGKMGVYETISNKRISSDPLDALCTFNEQLIGITPNGTIVDVLDRKKVLVPSPKFERFPGTSYIVGPNMIRSIAEEEITIIKKFIKAKVSKKES